MRVQRVNPPANGVGQTSQSRACHLSQPNARPLREMRARVLTLLRGTRKWAVPPRMRHRQHAPLSRLGQGVCSASAPLCHPSRGGYGLSQRESRYRPQGGRRRVQNASNQAKFLPSVLCKGPLREGGWARAGRCNPPHAYARRVTHYLYWQLCPGMSRACLPPGESPEPHFGNSAFSVGLDPHGSRALAHTPGRSGTPASEVSSAASCWHRECCSPRYANGRAP
jgi:hypothetical protein